MSTKQKQEIKHTSIFRLSFLKFWCPASVSSPIVKMPTYDLSLVVKHALKRPEIVSVVKRMGEHIIENGGYIRTMEFVGNRQMPQKMTLNGIRHTHGNYFVMRVDLPIIEIPKLRDFGDRDSEILRHDLISVEQKQDPVCTLEEEFLPPSKRPSVQTMIDLGRRRPRLTKVYNKNTGLEFEPMFR